ncbi:FIG110192: hypothetical protein [hydrothermal vent metagenome]|uniref:COGs COG3146 n=1 Tax=hydrothermal vent metagenome TaxID=652676 RepID=A0A3B0WJU0_9ZZZZ
MNIVFTDNIASIKAEHWNQLIDDSNPFIEHDFLNALEQHDCLKKWGWQPQHCLLYDGKALIGACPAYIKDNSYGEFVFDWAWADAYQKNGLAYYPKLVTSIPFTPAQGPRLLALKSHTDKNGKLVESQTIKQGLIDALIAYSEKNGLSSAHFLFCENDDIQLLDERNLLLRIDCQYHWKNQNYSSFDDFLSHLTSKRRKNIKRERKTISKNNIRIETIRGENLNEEQWEMLYAFYRVTFMKKSGAPTLTLDFFKAVSHKLIAVFAYHENRTVAAAICFVSKDKLYGRHWGCSKNYNNLHFEVCYYTGIDYCINNQLKTFEPGAQGEHKIWRGFLPTKTQSAHWIANDEFRVAIKDFLQRETLAMEQHSVLLLESSPFKKQSPLPRGEG